MVTKFHLVDVVAGIKVSTIDLGPEYAEMYGVKALYETCLFKGQGNSDVITRYTDEQTAREAHAAVVMSLEFALDGTTH